MVEAEGEAAKGPHSLPRDTLLVRGVDRKTWLDGLLTCAVGTVAGGVAGYGLLLTKQGKIVTDVFLLDTGSELLLGVAPGIGAAVGELLDRYLVMEDAELERPTTPYHWNLAQTEAPELGHVVARGALQLGGLRALLAVSTEPPLGPQLAGSELLAKHGLGVFGVDFNERDNPHEASLDRVAVCWTKGCYLGQEVVCMQDMRGKVKRRLVALDGAATLLASGDALAVQSDVLAGDGSVVGRVSSLHRSPQGVRLLASIATSALDSPAELSFLGQPVHVTAEAG